MAVLPRPDHPSLALGERGERVPNRVVAQAVRLLVRRVVGGELPHPFLKKGTGRRPSTWHGTAVGWRNRTRPLSQHQLARLRLLLPVSRHDLEGADRTEGARVLQKLEARQLRVAHIGTSVRPVFHTLAQLLRLQR